MHRIDHATAVADLPAPGAAGTPGFFSEGDPALGAAATVVTQAWANAVQEEIAHVIETAGIELDKASNTQLYDAVLAIIIANASSIGQATTTASGIVELATTTETQAGTDAVRAVTPAAGAGTYAFRSHNLSDMASAATSRTNLGLGTAAVVNTGTGSTNVPTVAQADARYARLGVANNFGAFEQSAASFNSTSAERYKEAIESLDADAALALLGEVEIVMYRMRASGQRAAGVIAERLAGTGLGFCVRYGEDGQAEAVDYQPLFAVAAAAVQGLAKRLADVEATIGAA